MDLKDPYWLVEAYIDIVVKFNLQLGGANIDEGFRVCKFIVQDTPVTFSAGIPIDYRRIPRLLDVYSNMVPRDSSPASNDVEAVVEDIYTYELYTLADYEVRNLIVAPDAPMYDGTKSLIKANLSPFFKIIKWIIANDIDPH